MGPVLYWAKALIPKNTTHNSPAREKKSRAAPTARSTMYPNARYHTPKGPRCAMVMSYQSRILRSRPLKIDPAIKHVARARPRD